MNNRTKKILTWALLPVFVCLVMFAVELGFNWKRMNLPAEQQGEIALDLTAFTVAQSSDGTAAQEVEELPTEENIFNEDELFFEDEPLDGPALTFADENTRASIAWSGYIDQLKITGQVFNDTGYIVDCTLADGSTVRRSSTYNNSLSSDSIVIGADVTGFSMVMAAGGVSLTDVTVVNTARLSLSRMLFSGLCALCLYLLVALRRLIGRKAEYGFLIVSLVMGLFLSIAMPRNTASSFDDQIHFAKAWNLSMGSNVTVTNAADALMNLTWTTKSGDSFVLTLDTEDELRQLDAVMDQSGVMDSATSSITRQWILTDVGYLTQGLGLAAARAAGLPFHVQVIAARLFNMLTYTLLCFFAIRALKRFKLIFATVAMLPTPMFMASCFSYDPTCTGLCLLGAALVIGAVMDRDTKLSWQRALAIPVCFVLAGMIKAVYLPLMLLVLLLPRCKFSSNGQRLWYKIGIVVLMIAAIMSIMLAIGQDVSNIEDSRSDGADAMAQLAFILQHPFTYVGYFFTALYQHFQVYLVDSYRLTWAYYGGLNSTLNLISLIVILAACVLDYDPKLGQRFNWKQRLWVLFVALATIGLTFTAMYIGYSSVGSTSFGGVQGRYLLPALPLLYMLLSFDFVKNYGNRAIWNSLIYAVNAVVLMGSCATLVLLPLCM